MHWALGDARHKRHRLAAEAIRAYTMADLLPRAQAIEDGTDKEYDGRLKNIAEFADKLGIEPSPLFMHIKFRVSDTVWATQ